MKKTIIRNCQIVSDHKIVNGDVLIVGNRIVKIDSEINETGKYREINAEGLHLFPGVIDDQVHFREPGLTHKGEIYTEAKAAVAGGVTSFMEMPNVNPLTLTQKLLQQKYEIAQQKSLANFSFYMGASNDNLEEVMKTNIRNVCGVKIFMGSSTGDMLVDNEESLEKIFANSPILIATHCEDEQTIRGNLNQAAEFYGEDIPFDQHPLIRSEEACYLSSSKAIAIAKKHNTRLHILHISTGRETALFDNTIPLSEKRITAEACIHHLWFNDLDYEKKNRWIKWNPAIKKESDRTEIWEALLNDKIDVIATDHAPHTISEKMNKYNSCPSGGPLIQHTLVAMLDFYHEGKISLPKIAQKMAHDVAICFEIEDRGYVREGYFADLTLVDLKAPWKVTKENILAKCGWSPFEGHIFQSSIVSTMVSGHLVYHHHAFEESQMGMRLTFNR